MAIDPIFIWIALGALALLVVVGLFARGSRRAHTEHLKDKFGNEYDHVVHETGSRKQAEQELVARAEEVGKFDIRPFTVAERDRFRGEWAFAEQRFIERPTTAVVEADELVADMMRVRGYPMGDFDQHVTHLSVTHPRIVDHYRAGHRVIGIEPGKRTTEDLRQAMLHYRALFDELIKDVSGVREDVARDIPLQSEVAAAPRRERDVILTDEDDLRKRP